MTLMEINVTIFADFDGVLLFAVGVIQEFSMFDYASLILCFD